mmetsp:Transcript_15279/g.36341  ORF Transcript_15279/g.36341 Transcript_15279/m.36341 type:complete len:301 (+) Transcript_15279:133-1035(+)
MDYGCFLWMYAAAKARTHHTAIDTTNQLATKIRNDSWMHGASPPQTHTEHTRRQCSQDGQEPALDENLLLFLAESGRQDDPPHLTHTHVSKDLLEPPSTARHKMLRPTVLAYLVLSVEVVTPPHVVDLDALVTCRFGPTALLHDFVLHSIRHLREAKTSLLHGWHLPEATECLMCFAGFGALVGEAVHKRIDVERILLSGIGHFEHHSHLSRRRAKPFTAVVIDHTADVVGLDILHWTRPHVNAVPKFVAHFVDGGLCGADFLSTNLHRANRFVATHRSQKRCDGLDFVVEVFASSFGGR